MRDQTDPDSRSSERKLLDNEILAASLERRRQQKFDAYQEFTRTTAIYPGVGLKDEQALVYCALGLTGEAGEVAEKLKKLIRDSGGLSALSQLSKETRESVAKELGDVMWYVARMADELGYSLAEVAKLNVSKLSSRKARGAIQGSGDNR